MYYNWLNLIFFIRALLLVLFLLIRVDASIFILSFLAIKNYASYLKLGVCTKKGANFSIFRGPRKLGLYNTLAIKFNFFFTINKGGLTATNEWPQAARSGLPRPRVANPRQEGQLEIWSPSVSRHPLVMGGRIDDPLVRQGLTDQDQQWVVGHLPPLVKKKIIFLLLYSFELDCFNYYFIIKPTQW